MNGSAEPPLRLLFDADRLHLLPSLMSIKEPSPLKGGQFSTTDRGSQIFISDLDILERFSNSHNDNIMTECYHVW